MLAACKFIKKTKKKQKNYYKSREHIERWIYKTSYYLSNIFVYAFI